MTTPTSGHDPFGLPEGYQRTPQPDLGPDLLDKARAYGRAHPKAVILGVIVLALIVGIGLTVHSRATSGYHNMGTLEQAVTQESNRVLDSNGSGDTVTRVICVSTGANSATCNVGVSDGSATSLPITISPDGNSWINDDAGTGN
jgi:hypothetical protein